MPYSDFELEVLNKGLTLQNLKDNETHKYLYDNRADKIESHEITDVRTKTGKRTIYKCSLCGYQDKCKSVVNRHMTHTKLHLWKLLKIDNNNLDYHK